AYWLPPGAPAANGCGEKSGSVAHDTKLVADDVLTKRLRLGVGGDPHLVETTATIALASAVGSIAIEAPTAYLAADLTELHRVDPMSGATVVIRGDLATLSTAGVFAAAPVIASTPD